MTLRDQYAMAALTGLLSYPTSDTDPLAGPLPDEVVANAVMYGTLMVTAACVRWGHEENAVKRGYCQRCGHKVPEFCAAWAAKAEAEAAHKAKADETLRSIAKRMDEENRR